MLLLVAGGLAWWWQRQPPPPVPDASALRYPDFVVDGLRALTLDGNGHPSRRLWATQVRHYADDGSSELDRPVLVVFDQAADGSPLPPWIAHGNSGWITEAADEVLLQGDVVVERPAATPPLRLTSEELLVLPDFDYAETAAFARLTADPDWVTAASGLRVWFSEPMRAKLFGRVHASRAPQPAAAP